ncbi:MAG: high-potential iron-sulfur protein [Gammaproteobacteria bacterium]
MKQTKPTPAALAVQLRDPARRELLRKLTVIGVGTASIATAARARAEDLPKVDESSAQAKALSYVHDVSKLDAVSGQQCANCALYQGGEAEWGGCGIFPGRQVKASGWCTAWVKRAG